MKMPPLRKSPSWQRFLAGAAIGGCVSWLIFLFMFSTLHEKNSKIIKLQRTEIMELQRNISIWQEDFRELNKKNEEMLTIQEIDVKIINYEKYKIKDSQSLFEIKDGVKDDLNSLLAKDLTTVYKNKDLVKKTVENKNIKLNGKRYQLRIKEMYFYTTVHLVVELQLAR